MKTREGVSAVPYDPQKEKFLLVKRSEGKEENPGKWEFPGGFVEDDEGAREAAFRELIEETDLKGVMLRTGKPGIVETGGNTYRIEPFLMRVEGEVELSEEHSDHEWIELDELDSFDTVEGIRSELRALDLLESAKEVAVAVTRSAETGKLLVLKRDELMRENPGKWEFASGRIENGEEPEEAALRELEEETGLEGEVSEAASTFEVEIDGESYVVHPVLVDVEPTRPELSFEHTDFRWASRDELEELETVKGFQNNLEPFGIQ